MITVKITDLFPKVMVPTTKCPQFLHSVTLDFIGFLQFGHSIAFLASRIFLVELFFNSLWTSYLHSQSGVGHFPLSGILSVQTKLFRHWGHSIFSIMYLRETYVPPATLPSACRKYCILQKILKVKQQKTFDIRWQIF